MTAYYNEFDPRAAAWLRELIKQGHIPEGIVDERSIRDVQPADLAEYSQCHFFAGIGGWPLALRLAGVRDNERVWTGSCPCQPFSAAGKGKGSADERHLWPDFNRLIQVCKPPLVFGEQVDAAIRHGWLDGVFTDLEGGGYACGAVDLPAASVGAPHIRQRIFWVAHSESAIGRPEHEVVAESYGRHGPRGCGPDGGMGDTYITEDDSAKQGQSVSGEGCDLGAGDEQAVRAVEEVGASGMGEPDCEREDSLSRVSTGSRTERPRSHWSGYDVIPCRDGKSRRVESGTFPLAHGIPARVGRLRGYGNAIVPQVAAVFIQEVMKCLT